MTLKELIQTHKKIVFFGGAGVSTESGIPDFRSETGIYKTVKTYGVSPETILSRSYFLKHPETFYDFYKSTIIHQEANPNGAHLALAELEALGKLSAVITQNIDGLHQVAGSQTVHELHGSVLRNYCTHCGKSYSIDTIMASDPLPLCTDCGHLIRPDVTLYEEALHEDVIQKSIQAIREADLLIIGGTSLSVYPAAGFTHYYHGRHKVLINKGATERDGEMDLIIRDSIGSVLQSVL